MWILYRTELHQLTDSKAQVNNNNVNNLKFNNLARSYQEDTGVTGRLWQIGFCKQVLSFFLKEAIDVALHTIQIISNIRSIKSKTKAEVFD